jgi:hypothetical protein
MVSFHSYVSLPLGKVHLVSELQLRHLVLSEHRIPQNLILNHHACSFCQIAGSVRSIDIV